MSTNNTKLNEILDGDYFLDDLVKVNHQFAFGYNKPTNKSSEWAGTHSLVALDDEGEYNNGYADEGFEELED